MKLPFLKASIGMLICICVACSGNRPYACYIPEGYNIRESVVGDINGDNIADMIMVLQNDSEAPFAPYIRPVVILTGTGYGYVLAARCDSVAMRTDMGGAKISEPYSGMVINARATLLYLIMAAWVRLVGSMTPLSVTINNNTIGFYQNCMYALIHLTISPIQSR